MPILRCLALALGVLAFACGGGESAEITAPGDAQAFVDVNPSVNICPMFRGSLVIPVEIPPTVAARVVALANDPDGDDRALSFEWSADSGAFSDPKSGTTHYTCAALGPHVLRVTARDPSGCSGRLSVNVNCVEH